MAKIRGPRKLYRYTDEFKLKAVKLTQLTGVQVKDVAEALDIHPWMLSRWRTQAAARALTETSAAQPSKAQSKELQELALLKEEHALLKKPYGSVPNDGRSVHVHRFGAEPIQCELAVCAVRPIARSVLCLEASRRQCAGAAR